MQLAIGILGMFVILMTANIADMASSASQFLDDVGHFGFYLGILFIIGYFLKTVADGFSIEQHGKSLLKYVIIIIGGLSLWFYTRPHSEMYEKRWRWSGLLPEKVEMPTKLYHEYQDIYIGTIAILIALSASWFIYKLFYTPKLSRRELRFLKKERRKLRLTNGNPAQSQKSMEVANTNCQRSSN